MRLSELRNAMSGYATRFDAALVSAHDAVRVVDDAAVIEKMAATVKTLAAARVAETELWKCDGDRSAAHQLARTTGTSVGAANEALESARRLRELPATEAAARRGELSAQQVATITDAVAADPDAEARLLEQSRTRSLAELRDECARAEKPTRRAKILARVDLPALLRGHPVGDEICEFAGYGPVAVSAIRDLIDTRDPFLVAIATKARPWSALPTSADAPTLTSTARSSGSTRLVRSRAATASRSSRNDHRENWADTHTTVFELLDRLCTHHHALKTTEQWALVEGRGKRAFVPPDDPQHPRNAHGPPVAA